MQHPKQAFMCWNNLPLFSVPPLPVFSRCFTEVVAATLSIDKRSGVKSGTLFTLFKSPYADFLDFLDFLSFL